MMNVISACPQPTAQYAQGGQMMSQPQPPYYIGMIIPLQCPGQCSIGSGDMTCVGPNSLDFPFLNQNQNPVQPQWQVSMQCQGKFSFMVNCNLKMSRNNHR